MGAKGALRAILAKMTMHVEISFVLGSILPRCWHDRDHGRTWNGLGLVDATVAPRLLRPAVHLSGGRYSMAQSGAT